MVDGFQAVWLAIMVIGAALGAATGGVLAWLDGKTPAGAILTGAGVFAGMIALEIAIYHFLMS